MQHQLSMSDFLVFLPCLIQVALGLHTKAPLMRLLAHPEIPQGLLPKHLCPHVN